MITNFSLYLDQVLILIVHFFEWLEKSLFLFLTEEAYSHGGLQTRELGQTPLWEKKSYISIFLKIMHKVHMGLE